MENEIKRNESKMTSTQGTEHCSSVKGYSLKANKLKRWRLKHNYTRKYIADRLRLSVDEMEEKLMNNQLFNRKQIRALVYLMGAQSAFKVLYFPSVDERNRIREEVFGTKGVTCK